MNTRDIKKSTDNKRKAANLRKLASKTSNRETALKLRELARNIEAGL